MADESSVPTEQMLQESDVKQKTVDLDDILLKVGRFGRFQLLLLLSMVLVQWSVGYQNMCPVFTINIPRHRCQVPAYLGNDTYQVQSRAHQRAINDVIPVSENGQMESCQIFSAVVSGNTSSLVKQKCSSWVYDKSDFERTLATDLSMVCGNKIIRSHSNMLIFVGKLLGAILQGFASDRFGRRRVLVTSCIGMLAAGVGNCFVSSITALFIMRFFTGMTTTASYLAAYVLAVEYMRPSDRTKVSFVGRLAFVGGQLSLTPIAFMERDWKMMQAAIIWPTVLLVLLLWRVPESARWLMAGNQKENALKQLRRMAKMNRASLTNILTSGLKFQEDKPTSVKTSPLNLFKDVKLSLRWLVVYTNWMVIAMVYYGLTLNVSNMGGNIFFNYFLNVLVDLIATIATGFLVDRVSRKYFHMSAMMIGGGACALTFIPVMTGADQWVIKALSLVGKMGISSAFFIIYIYTAELFPTQYRAFGLGSSSMIARIGGIASPYVADLNTYVHGSFGQVLPQLIFGGAGILAGMLILSMPETRNRKLPDTIEDCRNLDNPQSSHDNPQNY